MVRAAKEWAMAAPRRVACRLLAAEAVRRPQAAAARPWFLGLSASAKVPAMLSAKELAAAVRLSFRGRSASALALAMPSAKELAAAVRLWFRGRSASALAPAMPSAKV